MRVHSVAVVLAVIVAVSAGCGSTPDGRIDARHVVFISLDTVRADHLGLYGNGTVKTPNLDRLASESIVLDDFMTAAPTTLASHATLFTGKYPHSHGTPRNGFVVNDENVLLAELLRDGGFKTAGFAASFALASRFGIARGMGHYDEEFSLFSGSDDVIQDERNAEAVTGAALGWLGSAGADDRLFMFVHYFDAHAPYAAPPPYDTMYDERGREGLPEWFSVSQECSLNPGVATEINERFAAQYASEISYLDHHVGRLLDALREKGILDETLLVVTSDHGENLWDHPACFDHGWNVFQSTIRSMGIVRLPGALNAGTRVGTVTGNIDILPSVLESLGISLPNGIDGDAIDLRHPERTEGRIRFAEATKPWKSVEGDPRWTNMLKARCIRSGPYKYVHVPYQNRHELYDLERDPGERTNLLASPDPETKKLAATLFGSLGEWALTAHPLPSRFEISQRDETIRRLKALGYLGEE